MLLRMLPDTRSSARVAQRQCRRIALAALLLAGSAAAAGEAAAGGDDTRALDALLATEIEGASRHLERALDAPAHVTVFGAAEAAALGSVTVGDMLARLPGVLINSERGYGGFGLRGFSRSGDWGARLLMTIDGYRVNDGVYDQALPQHEFPIVADWVKRAELIYGPASSVYGSNALIGVANIVTLDGADAPGLRVRAAALPRGGTRLGASYGRRDGATDLFIGAARHLLPGETLTLPELAAPNLPDGRIAGLDGLAYSSLFAKLRHGPWRATFGLQSRDKSVATAAYGTAPGVPGTRYEDYYGWGELAYEGEWQGDWRTQARASLSAVGFEGRYRYAAPAGSGWLDNIDRASARWLSLDARAHWRGWLNHQWLFGAELRHLPKVAQSNFNVEPPVVNLDIAHASTQLGLYLQDHWRLDERTSLTLGLRADRARDFDVQWSPRLSFVHRPDADSALKLMIGRAFRVPNQYERFYGDDTLQLPRPQPRPEHIQTIELAWEQLLAPGLRASVAAYRNQFGSLIEERVTSGLLQLVNGPRAHITGVDFDIEQQLRSGWQWRTSVSLLDARGAGGRDRSVTRWLAKGHAFGPLAPQWSGGLQWQAAASRENTRGAVPSYLTLDLALHWKPLPQQQLSLLVANLFDRRSWDLASSEDVVSRVPRTRRTLALEWRGSF